jgi:hypothetical protein
MDFLNSQSFLEQRRFEAVPGVRTVAAMCCRTIASRECLIDFQRGEKPVGSGVHRGLGSGNVVSGLYQSAMLPRLQ